MSGLMLIMYVCVAASVCVDIERENEGNAQKCHKCALCNTFLGCVSFSWLKVFDQLLLKVQRAENNSSNNDSYKLDAPLASLYMYL